MDVNLYKYTKQYHVHSYNNFDFSTYILFVSIIYLSILLHIARN